MSDLLGPSGNRMNTLSRLGLLFGATGAGLQGQLPQFQQSLMAQQDAIRQRMQQQQQQQALAALVNPRRISTANQVFGNNPLMPTPDETMANNLLNAGLTQQAIAVGNPQLANALKGPQAPIVSKPGDIARDASGNVLWQNPDAPKEPAVSAEFRKFLDLANGNPNRARQMMMEDFQRSLQKPETPKDTFGDAAKLRGEFDTKTKDFAIIRDAYSAISTVAKDPSPAGDISLIFSYMKMLDPGSTVREGEYANAQNAASVPETIRAKFNKALQGETLTEKQRSDFVNQAGNLYKSRLENFGREYKRFGDLSQQYGINPASVVYDRSEGIGLNQGPKVLKFNPATGKIE